MVMYFAYEEIEFKIIYDLSTETIFIVFVDLSKKKKIIINLTY